MKKQLSDLGAMLPIDNNNIPDFRNWICWNDFDYIMHQGFDFACYLRKDNSVILGLPPVEIRSILDGEVIKVKTGNPYSFWLHRFWAKIDPRYRHYSTGIDIEHKLKDQQFPLYSSYGHVVPFVKEGQKVKKGEIIGKLYKSPGDKDGFLVHLHFMIMIENYYDRRTDPTKIFPELNSHICIPQQAPEFTIPTLSPYPLKPVMANFKKLHILFSPRSPRITV